MDEPFGAVDAMTREAMQAEFEKIIAETGQTVVFITHSIDEALTLADRVVMVSNRPGRVKEIIDVAMTALSPTGASHRLDDLATRTEAAGGRVLGVRRRLPAEIDDADDLPVPAATLVQLMGWAERLDLPRPGHDP